MKSWSDLVNKFMSDRSDEKGEVIAVQSMSYYDMSYYPTISLAYSCAIETANFPDLN